MVTKERRRISSSGRAQQLWDAIKAVRLQKQIPAITRMGRYMSRYYQLKKDETQRLLDLAVEDNLIKLETKIGTKGTKSGVEEKAYRLPTSDMLSRERHDWYCFKCHAGGEVLLCSTCHRVYHEECLHSANEEVKMNEEYVCKYCQSFQKIQEVTNKRDRRDLNHLFRIIALRSKKKLPDRIYAREVPQPPSKNTNDTLQPSGNPIEGNNGKKVEEELWRTSFLLKEQIDFAEIERKCLASEYRDLEEFKADAHLLIHNIIIYHGIHSPISDNARASFRDIVRDLRDLQTCRDCFRHSAESSNFKKSFIKPCRPLHELVYAKQKGFPFWPAKVICNNSNGDTVDVRFFGGQRIASVEKSQIRPISTPQSALLAPGAKRTTAFNRACEELRKHQEFIDRVVMKKEFDPNDEPYGNPFFNTGEMMMSESDNDEDDEMDDLEDTEGGGPGGDVAERFKKEDEELMRKPSFVPGEGVSVNNQNMNSNNTLTTANNIIVSTSNIVNNSGTLTLTSTPVIQQHHHPTTAIYSPQGYIDNANAQIIHNPNAPSSFSILPSTPQQYHILHHHSFPNNQQLRLVPVSTAAAGAINPAIAAAASSLDPNTNPELAGTTTTIVHHGLPTPGLVPAVMAAADPTGVSKKKRGRPKKSKKEEAEDFVSSSSGSISSNNQDTSRFINAGVQTPPKLLKSINPGSAGVTTGNVVLSGNSPSPSVVTSNNNNSSVSSSNVLLSAAAGGTPNPAANPVSSAEMPIHTQQSIAAAASSNRKPTERELKEFADKLRADFEQEKKRAVNVATRSLERDLERLKADHNTEIEELLEKHKNELSENKKKQWCYHCEAEAIYWCCWNTAYCSIECQQEHWHKEHKRMCRRKR